MSRQTLTSLLDSVLCLMRAAHARFLSDTARCRMVTSKSVCCVTVPDAGQGPAIKYLVFGQRAPPLDNNNNNNDNDNNNTDVDTTSPGPRRV